MSVSPGGTHMKLLCPLCGKETDVGAPEGFDCAVCGGRLRREPYGQAFLLRPVARELPGEKEAVELVRRSARLTKPKERKALLDEAVRLCPDSLEVNRAVLLFGRLGEADQGGFDFHRIKSYLLHAFEEPEKEPGRDAMIEELIADGQLKRCLELAPDRNAFLCDYCAEMCREYVRVFLKGDTEKCGRVFGIRIGRLSKLLSRPAAKMFVNIEKAGLPEPFDTMLPDALKTAYELDVGDFSYVEEAVSALRAEK